MLRDCIYIYIHMSTVQGFNIDSLHVKGNPKGPSAQQSCISAKPAA